MRSVVLPPRLAALLEMIQSPKKVADIGCDHGKLSAAMALMGIPVVAVDISEPSLRKTMELKNQLGLDNIETRLGDGLVPIHKDEVDLVIMAGVGQQTIIDILKRDWDKVQGAQLLLQSMDGAYKLRRYLSAQNVRFVDESLSKDNNRIYCAMLVQWGNGPELSEIECILGPVLLKKQPDLFHKFLQEQISKLYGIIAGLNKANSPQDAEPADYERTLKSLMEVRDGHHST
ncbi:MAG: class I SAM-dependent methyltransferase [Firmicutes bacterium]|nr:class I SAM-dependent methyltransferase [Bacillota bacterium]